MKVGFYVVPNRTKNLFCRLSSGKARKTFALGYFLNINPEKLEDGSMESEELGDEITAEALKEDGLDHIFRKVGLDGTLSLFRMELISFYHSLTDELDEEKKLDKTVSLARVLLQPGFDRLIYTLYDYNYWGNSTIKNPEAWGFRPSLAYFEKAFQQYAETVLDLPSLQSGPKPQQRKSYITEYAFFPTFTIRPTSEKNITYLAFTKNLLNIKLREAFNAVLSDDLILFNTHIMGQIMAHFSIDLSQLVLEMYKALSKYQGHCRREAYKQVDPDVRAVITKDFEQIPVKFNEFLSLYPFLPNDQTKPGQFMKLAKETDLVWLVLYGLMELKGDRQIIDEYIRRLAEQSWLKGIHLRISEDESVDTSLAQDRVETVYIGQYDLIFDEPVENVDSVGFFNSLFIDPV